MTSRHHNPNNCPVCTRPDVPMWFRVLTALPAYTLVSLPVLFLLLWALPNLLAMSLWSGLVIFLWLKGIASLRFHHSGHGALLPMDDRW